jgi:pre-mRNA-processing factor 19
MGIASSNANGPDVDMADTAEETGGLPAPVIQQIDETYQALSSVRKKRKPPADYVTPARVKTFTAKHTIPSLHSSSPSGINSIALSKLNPDQFLTGGNDKIVQLYDRGTDKVLATLKGHTKKVNRVTLREREGEPTLLISGSADKSSKIWVYDTASGNTFPELPSERTKGKFLVLASTLHPLSSPFLPRTKRGRCTT